jgi:acetyl-CoA carboxylase alpha subunit
MALSTQVMGLKVPKEELPQNPKDCDRNYQSSAYAIKEKYEKQLNELHNQINQNQNSLTECQKTKNSAECQKFTKQIKRLQSEEESINSKKRDEYNLAKQKRQECKDYIEKILKEKAEKIKK